MRDVKNWVPDTNILFLIVYLNLIKQIKSSINFNLFIMEAVTTNQPKKDVVFEENHMDSAESSDNYENSDPVPEAFLHTSNQGLYETNVDSVKNSKRNQGKTEVSKISEDMINESCNTEKSRELKQKIPQMPYYRKFGEAVGESLYRDHLNRQKRR